MRSGVRHALWFGLAAFVVCGLAAPKVLSLLDPVAASPQQPEVASNASTAKRSGLRVAAVIVRPSSLAETITSTGTLLAEEGVELQAEVNGKVTGIHFNEGAHVRKGQLLLKLNDADLIAQRERARHRKDLAMLRERRVAQLLKQGVTRQDEYDAALSELNVQDAEISLIEAQIAKTEIRAPFDGVVGLRHVSEGSYVNATARIATLQRLERLKVDFAVPEKYASRLRPGTSFVFTVAGGEHEFSGEIYAIDPRIDAATRTLLVRGVCANPHLRLLPGAFANVALTLAQLSDALLVPAVAVVPGLNEKNVFVVTNGRAEQRAVEIGTRNERSVHVLSGLKAGDQVITSGLQQLRTGQEVTVMDDSAT